MRAAFRTLFVLGAMALLAACATGPARRVSAPAAQLQQLSVRADGAWDLQLRLQNYSSIPMRFDRLRLALTAAGAAAGDVVATPSLEIGPESADIVNLTLQPATAAKLAVADALAAGRGIDYQLTGEIFATPEKKSQARFDAEHRSTLSPAPGLPGVLR